MSTDKYKEWGYEITDDPELMRELFPVPWELDIQLDDLYKIALNGKKSGIKKLTRLILKYPKVPALKNYLSVLYINLDQQEKSYEVNHWIVAEHPNYLFGKINMAAEYFLKEQYEKIPSVLGEEMEIKALYPQRDIFHVTEIAAFYKIAIMYFSAINDLEQAKIRLDILKELASDSKELEIAENHFNMAIMNSSLDQMIENREDIIEVKVAKTPLSNHIKPPDFTHSEIHLLYANDFNIDKEIIDVILNLPRRSLIDDLNKVLEDSIIRYNYFKSKADDGNSDDKTDSFLIHALFILSEINATESLTKVLDVLRQDEDYIELYFGDLLTEIIWLVLYKIGGSDLETCKQFLFEPGIYTYSKTAVSEMATQIALNQPERKEEIIAWFRDIFEFFLNADLKDNVIDSDLLGILVNDVLDFKGDALMPEIEALYKKEIVNLSSCGDIDEVKQHFINDKDLEYKNEIISIFGIYEKIRSWSNDEYIFDDVEEEEIYDRKDIDMPVLPFMNESKKIGRNDPCPCGSGKKYKKCCLNK